MPESKKITLVKILENKVYFLTEDNKEIVLPKNLLPENSKIGQVFYLKISENLQEDKISSSQARVLLEEILNEEE
ncbi:MAG: hypothetical protein AB1465_04180 [Patescibacteria group bacterium]